MTTDAFGFPLPTTTGPICGRCKHRHQSFQAVKTCYQVHAEYDERAALDAQIDADNDRRYVRFLEDAGYEAARADEAREAALGVTSFGDAYRAACPWLFDDEDALAAEAAMP